VIAWVVENEIRHNGKGSFGISNVFGVGETVWGQRIRKIKKFEVKPGWKRLCLRL
jgi:hypothetical protein